MAVRPVPAGKTLVRYVTLHKYNVECTVVIANYVYTSCMQDFYKQITYAVKEGNF